MSAKTPRANDTVAVDTYVFDTLMHDLIGHDGSTSAFVVYLHLWRQSHGVDEPTVQMSLRDIAEGTGFSKRGVQEALTILAPAAGRHRAYEHHGRARVHGETTVASSREMIGGRPIASPSEDRLI